MWITMVKAHSVVITVQVDMNSIVVCERIMKLQPAKKMNLIMMNESDGSWCRKLTLFERTYHHLLYCFPDESSLVEPIARIEEIQRAIVCIVL